MIENQNQTCACCRTPEAQRGQEPQAAPECRCGGSCACNPCTCGPECGCTCAQRK